MFKHEGPHELTIHEVHIHGWMRLQRRPRRATPPTCVVHELAGIRGSRWCTHAFPRVVRSRSGPILRTCFSSRPREQIRSAQVQSECTSHGTCIRPVREDLTVGAASGAATYSAATKASVQLSAAQEECTLRAFNCSIPTSSARSWMAHRRFPCRLGFSSSRCPTVPAGRIRYVSTQCRNSSVCAPQYEAHKIAALVHLAWFSCMSGPRKLCYSSSSRHQ